MIFQKVKQILDAIVTGFKNSPGNTIFALMGVAVLGYDQVQTLLDNDPFTNPNWNLIWFELMFALGLVASRDNNVSSEQAKKELDKLDVEDQIKK